MTAALVAAIGAAGLMGITHAIEPDHVAGISAITSEYDDVRRSVLAGGCFAVGHVGLVVLWVLGGYVVLGRVNYPQLFETIGTAGVGALLGFLGAAMAVAGLRRSVHAHAHEHGDVVHEHTHLHILPGQPHDHAHGVRGLLATGVVGALFTLSPPLTMIAFSSTLIPRFGPGVVALAIGVYAVAIIGTMGLLGAGVGYLFRLADDASDLVHAGLQVATGLVLGSMAFAVFSGVL